MAHIESSIVAAGDYVYAATYPPGCEGQRYRAHRIVLDVPSNQEKVLVEALTGRDKGLFFVCSLQNFSIRYKLIERAP